jgi:hypothetical protein
VRVTVVDAETGTAVPALVREITYSTTTARIQARHELRTGKGELSIPGTARLRAEAEGYVPLTLSPFLDNPELVKTITGLSDLDLLNWETFDRVKKQLGNVELVFRLQKSQR